MDEAYDPARIEQLRATLLSLAAHIQRLDAAGRLLEETPALLRVLGEVRSELFRYEVRATYDTPEQAEHRRIVGDDIGWTADRDVDPDDDEETPWRPLDP